MIPRQPSAPISGKAPQGGMCEPIPMVWFQMSVKAGVRVDAWRWTASNDRRRPTPSREQRRGYDWSLMHDGPRRVDGEAR